ncbi:MAG: SurA N-terminal domain-containing protein [Hyphomicrobiales bacterium]
MRRALFAVIVAAAISPLASPGARAEGQSVVVTVNDLPITNFDIDQRIRLWSAIGQDLRGGNPRKEALQSLIDDMIKRAEAKKWNAEATPEMVDEQVGRMAKGSGTDTQGLTAKLKAKGVSVAALKDLVRAQISFNRLLNALYKVKVEVDPGEVDKKYREMAADPRLKPVPVYEIIEVTLPVDKTDDTMAQQLLLARAADAAQLARQYKGCGSLRQAASGIYNVKISSPIKADGRKLPPPLKAALDKAGPGKIIGPGRAPAGIQLIAFCSKSTVAPPAPSREQIEMMLMNKKYDVYEERYMRELRRSAFIDYKDPQYAAQ